MRVFLTIVVVCGLLIGCGPAEKPATGTPSPVTPGAKSPDAQASAQKAESAPATGGTPIKVAFVTNNASDFWKIAEAGTRKAQAEFGCEVIFRIPSAGTAEQQQQIVQDLITSGVSGIAISPKDPENQTEMLNEAAAKVNLVTQDSDAPNSNRKCYVGTNNYEAGKAAAELIKKALPNGGKLMLFVGTLDAQNALDRKRGIEEALAGTGIEIVDTRTDETDRLKAIQNVQDTLVANPEVGCLVGLWSYNGPAILNGVRDSGKLGQVKIVCFDEEDEALQGVKDGHILGTIVQQPYEFGYQSVKVMVELAQGNTSSVPADKQLFIPVLTVTQENVDEFWKQLKERVGKS